MQLWEVPDLSIHRHSNNFFPPLSEAAPDHELLNRQQRQKTGSRSGCNCPAAFQWLGTLLSPAEKTPCFGKCKRMLLACKHTGSCTRTNRHSNVHIIILNVHTQWQWNVAQTNRQISTHTTHTLLLLRHSKEQHNQTRFVQWCCLNGVKQWSSLASESGQMMSIPGGWIGGFSLLHTCSSGPDNMHQCTACYCGLKYQLLAWKQQLISMQANSMVLANLQVFCLLHRCYIGHKILAFRENQRK